MFQTLNKNHGFTGGVISRRDMLRIVKERWGKAELPESICNHTFRGTGITVFLQNSGALEAAQDMANHRTRARPSSTTGARIWLPLARSRGAVRLNDQSTALRRTVFREDYPWRVMIDLLI